LHNHYKLTERKKFKEKVRRWIIEQLIVM